MLAITNSSNAIFIQDMCKIVWNEFDYFQLLPHHFAIIDLWHAKQQQQQQHEKAAKKKEQQQQQQEDEEKSSKRISTKLNVLLSIYNHISFSKTYQTI